MLGQLFLAFYVIMFAKQGMNRSTRTPTLSLLLREKRREKEKREGTREREGERDGERDRERRDKRTPSSLLPVCRFTTSPCVGSKRSRVYRHHVHMLKSMCVCCRHTR